MELHDAGHYRLDTGECVVKQVIQALRFALTDIEL